MPVTLRRVAHAFGDGDPLFTGVDWTFRPGAVCAVVGPSGSGKSTLLAIIAGMISPQHGTVDRPPGSRVGWVFQNPFGAARRTTLDHVALPMLARHATRRAADSAALALLDEFGLVQRAGAVFSELSGGEAQRLMLARGIAAAPDVLLVDEPTAQLDRSTADHVNDSIGVLALHGSAVVVATHDHGTRDACTETLDLGRYRPEPSAHGRAASP